MASALFLVVSCFVHAALATCPVTPRVGNLTKSDKCLYPEPCNQNISASNNTGYDPYNSPFWETALSPGGDHEASDTICLTYFPSGQEIYYVYRHVTYKNGSCNIQRFFGTKIPGDTGVFRYNGMTGPGGCDTCVVNDYAIADACPGETVCYRCYLYGDCSLVYVNRDYFVLLSTSPNVTEECYYRAVAVGAAAGLKNDQPFEVPSRLQGSCVYQVGNNTCINGDRIPCEQRVTLEG